MIEYYREGNEIKSRTKKPRIPKIKSTKMRESTAKFWEEQERKQVARAKKKANRKAILKKIVRKFIK